MAKEKQLVTNVFMTSRPLEHDHIFTWRLRNLHLLVDCPNEIVKCDIHIHPESEYCHGYYRMEAKCHPDMICVRLMPRGICIDSPSESSYIGVCLNRKGEFAEIGNLGAYLTFTLEWVDGKAFTKFGEEVELEDGNTLVVKGRLVLPTCCVSTEIVKEDTVEVNADSSTLMGLCEAMKDGFILA